MRTIKKEFLVYEISELNQTAKNAAIDWVANDDFYNMGAAEFATEAGEEVLLKFFNKEVEKYFDGRMRGYQMLVDYNHAKPELEWDTCSAGFVKDLEVSVPLQKNNKIKTELKEIYDDYALEEIPDELYQDIATAINESLEWSFDNNVIEDYILGNEYEFNKYGKFYRD